MVNYRITPNDKNQSQSGAIAKVDPTEAGLQWGDAPEHKFFGIYPASIIKSADQDDQAGIITAEIPVLQNPVGWRHVTQTIPGEGVRNVHFGEPNMDFAAMFAYHKVNKDTISKDNPISLAFENLITVLDITIPGPKAIPNMPEQKVVVTNVHVDVVEGTKQAISGEFKIHMNNADDNQGKPICTPSDDPGKVTNRISISCYDPKTGKGIALGPNDVLNVKAFVIPDDKQTQTVRKFKITVAQLNGSNNSITINNENPTNPDKRAIVPHKINRILLPALEASGEPTAWMGNLDDDIYLTELSVPGSKMSYLTRENGANPAFQTKTIEQQFDAGVRAFIVQTGAEITYTETQSGSWPFYKYGYEYNSCSMPVWGAATGTKLENTLDAITKELKKEGKQTECAFLVLTCHSSLVKNLYYYNGESHDKPRGKGQPVNWTKDWIKTVEKRLTELDDKYPIYKGEITEKTTLGDVRGKIVIKVNYNDESQQNYLETNANVPALFGIWKKPEPGNLAPVSDLYWGTTNPPTLRKKMNWVCQEATNVGENAEITVANKKTAITEMFNKNIELYTNNEFGYWFMNDIGGIYTYNNSTIDLAKDMNQIAVEHLQTRKKNAATGLVFLNFADRAERSGADCKSDYIIATIIDNNFKFALRKKGSN